MQPHRRNSRTNEVGLLVVLRQRLATDLQRPAAGRPRAGGGHGCRLRDGGDADVLLRALEVGRASLTKASPAFSTPSATRTTPPPNKDGLMAPPAPRGRCSRRRGAPGGSRGPRPGRRRRRRPVPVRRGTPPDPSRGRAGRTSPDRGGRRAAGAGPNAERVAGGMTPACHALPDGPRPAPRGRPTARARPRAGPATRHRAARRRRRPCSSVRPPRRPRSAGVAARSRWGARSRSDRLRSRRLAAAAPHRGPAPPGRAVVRDLDDVHGPGAGTRSRNRGVCPATPDSPRSNSVTGGSPEATMRSRRSRR